MRKFSSLEKLFIKIINESKGYKRNIFSLIESYLKNTRIKIYRSKKVVEFNYKVSATPPSEIEFETAVNALEELQEKIVIAINLVNYLSTDGYLYIYEPVKESEEIVEFGENISDAKYISLEMLDSDVVDLYTKYINKIFIPSHELLELEKNEFLSGEELQFNKQIFVTWAAIIVSLIIGISGILYNIYHSYNQEKKDNENMITIKTFSTELPLILKDIKGCIEDSNAKIENLHTELKAISKKVNLVPKKQEIEVKLNLKEINKN